MKSLKNKDVRNLIKEIKEDYSLDLSNKDKYESNNDLILINNEVKFFYHENKIIPTLKLLLKNNFLKKITVDMGAVKFMVNGADVMRPGVTEIEAGIKKDDIVSIIDENNKKPLVVGLALFSSEEMISMKNGKITKNLHYVGDRIWG